MLRAFSVATIVIAAVAAATPAAAKSTGMGSNGFDAVCGPVAKKFTYLFWPNGHAGLPTSFPPPGHPVTDFDMVDVSKPHVSVYRVGAEYPDDNWLLTVQVRPGHEVSVARRAKRSATTKPCGLAHGAKWKPAIAHRKTTRKATALTCRFRTKYGYVGFGKAPGEQRLKVRAHDKWTVFLEADTAAGKPRLRYNTRFCKGIALPG
jgi:hypothetical protein